MTQSKQNTPDLPDEIYVCGTGWKAQEDLSATKCPNTYSHKTKYVRADLVESRAAEAAGGDKCSVCHDPDTVLMHKETAMDAMFPNAAQANAPQMGEAMLKLKTLRALWSVYHPDDKRAEQSFNEIESALRVGVDAKEVGREFIEYAMENTYRIGGETSNQPCEAEVKRLCREQHTKGKEALALLSQAQKGSE